MKRARNVEAIPLGRSATPARTGPLIESSEPRCTPSPFAIGVRSPSLARTIQVGSARPTWRQPSPPPIVPEPPDAVAQSDSQQGALMTRSHPLARWPQSSASLARQADFAAPDLSGVAGPVTTVPLITHPEDGSGTERNEFVPAVPVSRPAVTGAVGFEDLVDGRVGSVRQS